MALDLLHFRKKKRRFIRTDQYRVFQGLLSIFHEKKWHNWKMYVSFEIFLDLVKTPKLASLNQTLINTIRIRGHARFRVFPGEREILNFLHD